MAVAAHPLVRRQHASQAASLLRHLSGVLFRYGGGRAVEELDVLADGLTVRGVTRDALGQRFELTCKRLED